PRGVSVSFLYSASFSHCRCDPRALHSSLHDALPICAPVGYGRLRTWEWSRPTHLAWSRRRGFQPMPFGPTSAPLTAPRMISARKDRKSTRLNSSHLVISYAVFCLTTKKKQSMTHRAR